MSADCLHFQLFVYIFSCLFTFSAVCLLFVSWLFTFSAVCLLLSAVCLLCQLISAICLLFVSWFQLFVYFLSAEISCLFTFCQLIVYNLNFRVKNLVFPWLFCHYRCFNTLIVNEKKFNFLPFFNFFNFSQTLEGFFKNFWTFGHFFTNLLEFFKVFGYLKKKWTWLVPIFKKVIQLWRVWRRLLNKHEINTFYFILCRSRKSFVDLRFQASIVDDVISRWCHFGWFGATTRLVDLRFQASIVDDVISRWCHFGSGQWFDSWTYGFKPPSSMMSFRFGAMIRLVDLRFQASFVDGASEPRIDLKPKKQSNLIHQLTP